MSDIVKGIYITSNVASMFPREDDVFNNYTLRLKNEITTEKYHFIAIHFQEMGRKNAMLLDECVQFLNDLRNIVFPDYPHAIAMIDSSFEKKEIYTALCNMYIWKDVNLYMYNFETSKYQPACSLAEEKFIYTYQEDVLHSKHCKFQLDMLPYSKNSRKGFTITNIHFGNIDKAFSLVNLHLVHDMTFEESPKNGSLKYCAKFRKMEYEMIVKEINNMKTKGAILFGDFNFRTNEQVLFKELVPKFVRKVDDKTNVIQFLSPSKNNIIATSTSDEICLDEMYHPTRDTIKHFMKSDTEGKILLKVPHFREFNIDFIPTYCFKKNDDGSECYLKNRLPSYCDRIFLYGKKILKTCQTKNSQIMPKYFILGEDCFLADHKPVCIRINFSK